MAFAATVNPDLTQGATSDIYVLSVDDNASRKIVAMPGADTNPQWSPDGKFLAFNTALGNTSFGSDRRLAIIASDGTGVPRSLTNDFDEDPTLVAWESNGIYFAGSQKTASHLFFVDPQSPKVTRVSSPDDLMASSFSFTSDGQTVAFAATSPSALNELYVSNSHSFSPRPLTQMSAQVKDWKLGTREVISWKSEDGATIEGILIKPPNFDPTKKYPLFCIIHGGPNSIDRPGLLSGDTRYYPADIWADRGALILKVNYRGSIGYGAAFRKLAFQNLGIGDSWDVLSGVDYLVSKGWVDEKKIACMGWSEGGYISAFLTTSSSRFAAISVGAGISDWSTYYYNTDITNFTLDYLGGNPIQDPEIYRKTSPITYIRSAQTPTLIQHGELDKRVPIANSYELRQALEDRGVPVEMIVYKGFGHAINRPKSMRAVMEHNLAWFNHYIWGDAYPNFARPDVPPSVTVRNGKRNRH
jgi:dipeptidyl aminopeptidase/acylaminoacyl peptidase